MTPATPVRFALRRSLDAALIAVGGAALLLGVFEYAVMPLSGPDGLLLSGLPLLLWVYVGGGLVVWRRRPSHPMGFLLVIAGAALYLATIGNATPPALQAIGAVSARLGRAAILHVLLAFPSGRLTRAERAIVICGYVVSVPLGAPRYLFDPHGPFPPFAIVDAPAVADAVGVVQDVAGALVAFTAAVVLVDRIRRTDVTRRRVLIPLFAYGLVALVYAPVVNLTGADMFGLDPLGPMLVQIVLVAGIPILFAVGVLRGGFARTNELEELSLWLGSATRDRLPLEALLATALDDPTLRLGMWVAERESFVRHGGQLLVPHDTAARGWQVVRRDGRTIGAFSYDATRQADRSFVERAGNVVAIAMAGEQLTAELVASRQALMRSRERIVQEADRERRRIAHDLHDGLQAQLVMLALEAHRIASVPAEEVPARARRLRADIDAAAADLRAFVHDLVPAALIERGLTAAAEDLVDRMPIATAFEDETGGDAFGAVIENTAYHVIAEGLANVVKHAHAHTARVCIRSREGALWIEIVDDGTGMARPATGGGLSGLADRVDAVGGSLRIDSAPGAGTTVRAQLPCGS